jgi:hypothetical protein
LTDRHALQAHRRMEDRESTCVRSGELRLSTSGVAWLPWSCAPRGRSPWQCRSSTTRRAGRVMLGTGLRSSVWTPRTRTTRHMHRFSGCRQLGPEPHSTEDAPVATRKSGAGRISATHRQHWY